MIFIFNLFSILLKFLERKKQASTAHVLILHSSGVAQNY